MNQRFYISTSSFFDSSSEVVYHSWVPGIKLNSTRIEQFLGLTSHHALLVKIMGGSRKRRLSIGAKILAEIREFRSEMEWGSEISWETFFNPTQSFQSWNPRSTSEIFSNRSKSTNRSFFLCKFYRMTTEQTIECRKNFRTRNSSFRSSSKYTARQFYAVLLLVSGIL